MALVHVGASAQEDDGPSFAKASEGKLPLVARIDAAGDKLAEGIVLAGQGQAVDFVARASCP